MNSLRTNDLFMMNIAAFGSTWITLFGKRLISSQFRVTILWVNVASHHKLQTNQRQEEDDHDDGSGDEERDEGGKCEVAVAVEQVQTTIN